jgi:hypothetical protein
MKNKTSVLFFGADVYLPAKQIEEVKKHIQAIKKIINKKGGNT